jgi:hypothetical protein
LLARIKNSDAGGPPENYTGYINRLGLDLGIKAGGVMAWGVFAPASGYHHGALAGKYVGGSGSASLGVGLGANALIGGSHRSIALQPLSVEGQVGVDLALCRMQGSSSHTPVNIRSNGQDGSSVTKTLRSK